MIRISDKAECTGCTACVAVCPRNCIEMKEDREGFLYPKVQKRLCIDCGLCSKVCPTQKFVPQKKTPISVYAAINNSEEIRAKSSSGGVFYALAEYIIKKDGVVYGAAFDDDWSVHHIGIERVEDIGLLQGSKYVQSRMENCYREVQQYLKDGRKVLFSGTPCQNAGLRAYLRTDYENLYCVDIICHGVPSPKVWRRYLDMIEKKYGTMKKEGSIPSFRSKIKGWNYYSLVIPIENNEEYCRTVEEDLYLQTFLKDADLRPSCYQCHFKPSMDCSDLTIADFWEIENISPEMYDDKGTSLVIVNSDKGKQFFENVKDKFRFKEETYSNAIKGNPSAYHSVACPEDRKRFFFWLNIGGNIEWIMRRVGQQTWWEKLKGSICRNLIRLKKLLR